MTHVTPGGGRYLERQDAQRNLQLETTTRPDSLKPGERAFGAGHVIKAPHAGRVSTGHREATETIAQNRVQVRNTVFQTPPAGCGRVGAQSGVQSILDLRRSPASDASTATRRGEIEGDGGADQPQRPTRRPDDQRRRAPDPPAPHASRANTHSARGRPAVPRQAPLTRSQIPPLHQPMAAEDRPAAQPDRTMSRPTVLRRQAPFRMQPLPRIPSDEAISPDPEPRPARPSQPRPARPLARAERQGAGRQGAEESPPRPPQRQAALQPNTTPNTTRPSAGPQPDAPPLDRPGVPERQAVANSIRVLSPSVGPEQPYRHRGPVTNLFNRHSQQIDLTSLHDAADQLQAAFSRLGLPSNLQYELASSALNYLENNDSALANTLYEFLVDDVSRAIEHAATNVNHVAGHVALESLQSFSEALLGEKPLLIKEYNSYVARAGDSLKPNPMSARQKPFFDRFKQVIQEKTGIRATPGQKLTKPQLEQIAMVWIRDLVPTIKDNNYGDYGGVRNRHFQDNDGEGSLSFILQNKVAVCRELSITASTLFSEYGVQSHVAAGNVKQNEGDPNRGAHAWLEITDKRGDILLIVDSNNTKDHYDNFDKFSDRARGATYREAGGRQTVVSIKNVDLYADALNKATARI